MKRRLIVVSMLTLAVGFLGCNYSERKASNKIVARVEQFKNSTGRLPETLSEIGLKENESCPATARRAMTAIWFGTGQLWGSRTPTILGQNNGQKQRDLFVLNECNRLISSVTPLAELDFLEPK